VQKRKALIKEAYKLTVKALATMQVGSQQAVPISCAVFAAVQM